MNKNSKTFPKKKKKIPHNFLPSYHFPSPGFVFHNRMVPSSEPLA
jgi:hypothetical protein